MGAASALGEMNDQRAVEPLTDALEDPDQYVRDLAASSLKQMKANGLSSSAWNDLLRSFKARSIGDIVGIWFGAVCLTWLFLLLSNVAAGAILAALLAFFILPCDVCALFLHNSALGLLFGALTLANYYGIWRIIRDVVNS